MAFGRQVGLLCNPFGYQREDLMAIAIFIVHATRPTDR